jgi:hypothetical protein
MRYIKLISVFLISYLGLTTALYAVAEDPYQNVYDYQSIKEFFLRRIANDELPDQPPFIFLDDNWHEWQEDTSAHPKGGYYPVENADSLNEVFLSIGRKIKLRLTE